MCPTWQSPFGSVRMFGGVCNDICFLGFSKQNSGNQKKLGRQNGRDAEGEFPVPGFMTECVHPNQTANAPTEYGGGEKRRFRDPPEIFLGPELVRKHKCASDGIDYKEVK